MKVTFLIDGFNLYHSIEDVKLHEGIDAKWLDIKTVLHSYLTGLGSDAKFHNIFYFTALRHHVKAEKPNSIERHKRYISVLESTGITTIYGKFKPKNIKCKSCDGEFIAYEEKKTDVAIASKLLELVHNNHSDSYVIVSGDTDLIPAIQLAKKMNNNIKIFVLFPYRRTNDEVKQYVDGSFKLKPTKYASCLFQGIVTTKNAGDIAKPSHW